MGQAERYTGQAPAVSRTFTTGRRPGRRHQVPNNNEVIDALRDLRDEMRSQLREHREEQRAQYKDLQANVTRLDETLRGDGSKGGLVARVDAVSEQQRTHMRSVQLWQEEHDTARDQWRTSLTANLDERFSALQATVAKHGDTVDANTRWRERVNGIAIGIMKIGGALAAVAGIIIGILKVWG